MSSNAARQGGFGRWIVIALGGVVFAVFAAVIWYAYVEVMGLGTGGPPPLVRAEAGPIKRAPDDPGGMEIPNRGSAVARVFDETVDGVRRERILPRQDTAQIPPEPEPASPPAPAPQAMPGPTAPGSQAAEPTAAAPVERLAAREPEPSAPLAQTQPATRPSITVTNQPPPPQAPAPAAQQAAPRPSTPPPAAAAPAQAAPRPAAPPPAAAQSAPPRVVTPPSPPPQQQAARTPPAATPPARSAPAAGPTYRVQLGAFRSDAAANQAWNLMQSRLGDTLGGLRPTVLEAQTSAGTFYRLQAGPLPNRDGAVRTCSQVKAAGNDCFIVGPLP